MQSSSSIDAVHSDLNSNSPLQRVPVELWSAIFVCCLPAHPSNNDERAPGITRDPRLTPVTLASVCRTWRHISCSTTELWATCWVNFVNPELNTTWLERAGPHMLRLYGAHSKHCRRRFNWGPLVLSILPFQKQWKSFELELGTWGTMDFIPEFDTPALETLLVPQTGTIPFWMASLLPNSPRLREVELDKVRVYTSLSVTRVHTRYLSTLKIAAITTQDVILVLSTFPQLLHLSVGLYEDDDTFRFDVPDVTHRNLVSLQVTGKSLPRLIEKITLPSLRTFQRVEAFDSDEFFDFVNRSHCHITEFSIGNHYVPDEDLIMTLCDESISQWVERLELPGSSFNPTTELLNLLCYNPNIRNFPHLAELLFHECYFEDVPDGLLADMVLSRRNSPDCEVGLRYISISWLDRVAHGLDIACLTPLPELERTDLEDATMIIDLVPADWIPDGISGGEFQNLYPRKVWLGRSSCIRHSDDL